MSSPVFETPLTISGPLRAPRQMLADQEYGGHVSIHDEKMADKMGFSGAPIEGPTHFSQFVPLLSRIWGQAWFESGCLSSHYQNMVVEGEEVRAFVEFPAEGATSTKVWAEKADGTPVLTGTASIGPDHPQTELERRIEKLRPIEKLVILSDMNIGDTGAENEIVKMDFDQHLGALYPFTLNEKLAVITENSPLHTATGDASPWGRPIIPLEMVCVLCQYSSHGSGWRVRQPSVGLFADLEIRMVKGPLFVGEEYKLEREIVALGESRRTEGYWVRTKVSETQTGDHVATVLLHHAIMKSSFPDYDNG